MAYTGRDDNNYIGELYIVGQNKTPLLNAIGGINGNNARITNSFTHPMSQPVSLAPASQPAITEDASVAAGTAVTYSKSQVFNTCQIFKKDFEVSYAKQATFGELSGLNQEGVNPVKDEKAFQKMMALKQIAVDYEYSLINGVYQLGSAHDVAAKMKGVLTAVTTNTLAAANAAISKAMINSVVKSMADNGAPLENIVMCVNSFQKQAITALYGYQPMSVNQGGLNIQVIETDFAPLQIMYVPNMPTTAVLFVDINYLFPVFCPVPNKGLLFAEDLAQVGASMKGQIFGIMGIDYVHESFHGSISGLKNS
jgi:hypothetical protein